MKQELKQELKHSFGDKLARLVVRERRMLLTRCCCQQRLPGIAACLLCMFSARLSWVACDMWYCCSGCGKGVVHDGGTAS
jgi:hypothetical protein